MPSRRLCLPKAAQDQSDPSPPKETRAPKPLEAPKPENAPKTAQSPLKKPPEWPECPGAHGASGPKDSGAPGDPRGCYRKLTVKPLCVACKSPPMACGLPRVLFSQTWEMGKGHKPGLFPKPSPDPPKEEALSFFCPPGCLPNPRLNQPDSPLTPEIKGRHSHAPQKCPDSSLETPKLGPLSRGTQRPTL